MRFYRFPGLVGLMCMVALGACVAQPENLSSQEAKGDADKKEEKKAPADVKRIEFKKNIVIEIQGDQRRVRVNAEVCLREGFLEQLLTCRRIKAHEAILSADIDARHLHAALLFAGAEAGKPVQFRLQAPPTGSAVKIFLEYKDKGKDMRVPAQSWIRNVKTKKDFHTDWVFAGSFLLKDPQDPKADPYYLANDGDVISVVNFEGACLDVPFLSTKDKADLDFEAHTERIPAQKTAVTVVLEPVPAKKK